MLAVAVEGQRGERITQTLHATQDSLRANDRKPGLSRPFVAAHRLLQQPDMKPFAHVLCPTDFSEGAARATELAAELAVSFDARLTLLHVVSTPTAAAFWYAEGLTYPVEEIYTAARRELDRSAEIVRRAHPAVATVLAGGDPRDEILSSTKELGADLVVMGTHGRRGLERLVLGSTAETVVRMSSVPVLVVGHPNLPAKHNVL